MHEQVKYPHLLPQDAPILTAFLKEHGARYTVVHFDVRIGAGRDPGPDFEPYIRNMALDLSRRRIDALGHARDHVDIIEVTDSAGTTTIGQLITYQELYIRDHHPAGDPKLILVARTLQTDMRTAFAALDIEIHLYPEA